MIVVDASAFIEVLLHSPEGSRVAATIAHEQSYAPHLLDAEVLHRLVTMGKQGLMGSHDVESGIGDLRDAPIIRVDHRPLLDAASRLAAASSGYDALYLALADRLGCPLLTADDRLARTAGSQFGISAITLNPAAERTRTPPRPRLPLFDSGDSDWAAGPEDRSGGEGGGEVQV